MAVKKRLSLCMLTRNNEKQLAVCLQDLKEIADEIIIVDLGSNDQTIGVAQQVGADVYQMQWQNDYSQAKNLCLDLAGGRWILFLQPNETIPRNQFSGIFSLLDNPNAEGYLLYIDNHSATYRISSPVQSLRLFRNRKEYRYQYRAFEQIPDELLNNVFDAGIRIIQHADPDLSGEVTALNLLLKEELQQHPEDSYLLYIYGIQLLNQQKYQASVDCFQKARQIVNSGYLFVPHLFKCLGWALLSLEQFTEALEVLGEGINNFPYYTDFLVLRAEVRKCLRQYGEAIQDLESSLKIIEQPRIMVPGPEIDISIILETLGDIHEKVTNYRQALACYHKSHELNVNNTQLLSKVVKLSNKIASIEAQEKLLMHHGHIDKAMQLMQLENDQLLEPLEYALWSKSFREKVQSWIRKMEQKTAADDPPETLILKEFTKAGVALMAFYHSLGLGKTKIKHTISQDHDRDLTPAKIHGEIGGYYAKQSKEKEALSAYLKALQWDPLDRQIQVRIKEVFIKNPNQVIALIEEKDWSLEGNWFPHKQGFANFVQGAMCFLNQQFEQALAAFSKLGDEDPSYPIAFAYMICNLWLAGNEVEAETRLNKQKQPTKVLAAFYRICQSYALERLREGCRQYPYSELLMEEIEKISSQL